VWLLSQVGTSVFVPFGRSPDTDLVAEMDERLVRAQVKTSTVHIRNGRYQVTLATRRQPELERARQALRFHALRLLFVLVSGGRQWWIPATVVEGTTSVIVEGRSTPPTRSIESSNETMQGT
jgi:hypothetical protein